MQPILIELCRLGRWRPARGGQAVLSDEHVPQSIVGISPNSLPSAAWVLPFHNCGWKNSRLNRHHGRLAIENDPAGNGPRRALVLRATGRLTLVSLPGFVLPPHATSKSSGASHEAFQSSFSHIKSVDPACLRPRGAQPRSLIRLRRVWANSLPYCFH